jgi:hypothetical protein
VEQAVSHGIVAIEVDQVVSFDRPRTAAEIEALEDAILAACCGEGHMATPTECVNDVGIGGGFKHHFSDDADAKDWGGSGN